MRSRWFLLVLLLGVLLAGCAVANNETPRDRTVSWEEAIEILNSDDVTAVAQLHSLEVTLQLRDGSIITTTEPNIDDIFHELDKCGSSCQDILRATE